MATGAPQAALAFGIYHLGECQSDLATTHHVLSEPRQVPWHGLAFLAVGSASVEPEKAVKVVIGVPQTTPNGGTKTLGVCPSDLATTGHDLRELSQIRSPQARPYP